MASNINVPPVTSQLPGSSATRSGQPTMPMAVLPLLDSTRNFVLLAVWVIPIRVDESRKRYSPVGSNSIRMNRKQRRACSMLAAQSRYSAPGTWSLNLSGVKTPGQACAPPAQVLPLPLGQTHTGRLRRPAGRQGGP